MLTNLLQQLGLSEKEAKIYLATLELGQTTVARIAKKSKVNRTTIYGLINELKEKGLIKEVKQGKKTFFYAEDPRRMKSQLERRTKMLEKVMPELLSIANVVDHKPKVKFFEGREEIKEIYKDALNHPSKEFLTWTSELSFKQFDDYFWYEFYLPKRKEKKIWVRAILADSEAARKFQGNDEKEFRKTKVCVNPVFKVNSEINLYGEKSVGIISFKDQIGLIIESHSLHETLRGIFELNWEGI